MINLSTKYMGFTLKNPIVIGSSGLTKHPEKIKEFEQKGAAAVVLKSLFEEQILFDINHTLEYPDAYNINPQALDYVSEYTKENSVAEYMKLIRTAKKEVKIPVFASINCVSLSEWVHIARDIQKAGADGLELNVFIVPGNLDINSMEREKIYFDIIDSVQKHITIPVALKLGYYFSSLVYTIQKFSWTKIASLVLFNRFFTPDINLKTMKLQVANLYSTPDEQYIPLRWIAMISDKVNCDISASTGIHNADAVIRQLLVGATTTQLCSAIYLHGPDRITGIIDDLKRWMESKNFKTIDDFRGTFSVKKTENPVLFQRVQYMKHLSGTE